MTRGVSGGSRFLFDGFDAAQARIEANERVAEERWAALDFRLAQIDAALERFNKVLTINPNYETALGNCAILLTEFKRSDTSLHGFQTQTWARLPQGWRLVSAHVSMIPLNPS